ncbi:MAG: aminotransferase class I/II-fold pyridoxal phosphate-dependent enzyme [Oscillospiraceae bacterium]|nr:aminotransferase class I/II-fold pyridoxal phosphate-dependent enzyme [Oscillospiraceae bacterium]
MIYFTSDYCEGCHEAILRQLIATNMEQTSGYGTDSHCANAARLIRQACCAPDADVHFLVGGTQTNLTVIDAALRPHQAAVCANTGHIHVHETGAVEATGHKILALPSEDGKITAAQVRALVKAHREDEAMEHTAQPKLVYISNPTELGTIYSKQELTALSNACRELGLFLFLDGARLGYGLMCRENDLTMADLAALCDAFYIGGTKVGALFGEALVISNPLLKEDFRYLIKQHGGMLAKGRLLGIQFETLFDNNLYFQISKHALAMADRLREAIAQAGFSFYAESPTNQLFPILPDSLLAELSKTYAYTYQCRVDEHSSAIRLCTSWATREEHIDAFCADLLRLSSR